MSTEVAEYEPTREEVDTINAAIEQLRTLDGLAFHWAVQLLASMTLGTIWAREGQDYLEGFCMAAMVQEQHPCILNHAQQAEREAKNNPVRH